jgi:hypothetical protein
MTETIEQFAARVAGVLHRTDVDVIRPLLLREMTAFLAQHRQIVEVTGEDYAEATRKHYTGVVPELYARRVEVINARLRARAVPASRPALSAQDAAAMLVAEIDRQPANEYRDVVRDFMAAHWPRHATDTGWVQCPTTQTAGELVVPEDGSYAVRRDDGSIGGVYYYSAGLRANGNAIRRIDTDAPTTWIERSPTTTRAWTAESVQACVGRVSITVDAEGDYDVNSNEFGLPADKIAAAFNRHGITAFYLLPEPPR